MLIHAAVVFFGFSVAVVGTAVQKKKAEVLVVGYRVRTSPVAEWISGHQSFENVLRSMVIPLVPRIDIVISRGCSAELRS